MASPPYMKLYIGDYLGDTHHLGALEHGAYLLLLMAMWRAGGRLPAADANLAKLARCSREEWAAISPVVLAFFKRSRGKLTHKRLAHEIAKYEDVSGKRKTAGKSGGEKKPLKNSAKHQAIASNLLGFSEAIADITRTRTRTIDSSEPNGSAQIDIDGAAWDTAIAVLTAQGGMTEKRARSFFGRLLSENRIEARDLLAPASQALANRTGDPQAYLRRAAEGVAKRRHDAEPRRVGFV